MWFSFANLCLQFRREFCLVISVSIFDDSMLRCRYWFSTSKGIGNQKQHNCNIEFRWKSGDDRHIFFSFRCYCINWAMHLKHSNNNNNNQSNNQPNQIQYWMLKWDARQLSVQFHSNFICNFSIRPFFFLFIFRLHC